MEKEDDGSVRDARIERSRPTEQEEAEFKILMIAMAIVMVCVFGMGVIGSVIIFWRIWG
jgi:Tfp pilus assembly protein PilN